MTAVVKGNWADALDKMDLEALRTIIRACDEFQRNHGSFPTAQQLRAVLEQGR